MNIGIIDADLLDNGTRHPNLALMKISKYMKDKGYNVKLLHDYVNLNDYDKVYISKVFNFTEIPINLQDYNNLEIGGTGFFEDGGGSLPYDIEHHMPDYTLYDYYIEKEVERGIKSSKFTDYKDYSIGFTTRGCFRKCDFCVNKKYDRPVKHSPLSEFFDPTRKRIYLWDDNILAFSGWREVFNELETSNKYFQFRQGLDIRLMTDEKAERLSKMKYYGDFIFAFDYINDKELIENKLEIWQKYNKKTTKLYVLCGFDRDDKYDDEFWKQDIIDTFERIKILMRYKCLPYIMRFEKYKESPYRGMYINLARWCNQPSFFKKKSFRNFCESNQNILSKNTCASVRYMKEFESDHPEVGERYFDLWFEETGN